jgi:hypothetical protein
MNDRRLMSLSSLAATSGAIILLACGAGSVEPPFARELFALSLVAQTAFAVVLFRRGHRRPAAMVAAVCAILLAFSFLPVYVRHYTPWGLNGDPHRHTIWELGHVH